MENNEINLNRIPTNLEDLRKEMDEKKPQEIQEQLSINFDMDKKVENEEGKKRAEELKNEVVDQMNKKYPYAQIPYSLVKIEEDGSYTIEGKDLEEKAKQRHEIEEPVPENKNRWEQK